MARIEQQGVQQKRQDDSCNLPTHNDPGSKHMRDIMALEKTDPRAKAVLEADRAGFTNATGFNQQNRNQNTYGALRLGFQVTVPNWQAADAGAKKTLTGYVQSFNRPGMTSYKPSQLPEIADELEKTANCVQKDTAKLLREMEITPTDSQHVAHFVKGAHELAANLRKLHKAVCQIPNVEVVHLDIPAQSH